MKKLYKNEQAKISSSNVDRVHDGSLSVYKNEMGDAKAKGGIKSIKFKAYHPKMMIVYREVN